MEMETIHSGKVLTIELPIMNLNRGLFI
jgi:hypothetical protein